MGSGAYGSGLLLLTTVPPMMHELDKRLTVIESQVKDIRTDTREIKHALDGLRIRVAGVSALVTIVVELVLRFMTK